MVVGLIVGLLQALTQIQEQTVAFVPKLIAMALALAFSLPWILTRLLEYTRRADREHPQARCEATACRASARLATLTLLQPVRRTISVAGAGVSSVAAW